MTKIYVPRGPGGSSNSTRSTQQAVQISVTTREDELEREQLQETPAAEEVSEQLVEEKPVKNDGVFEGPGGGKFSEERLGIDKSLEGDAVDSAALLEEFSESISQLDLGSSHSQMVMGISSCPPPPPVPPPRPPVISDAVSRRSPLGSSNSVVIGPARRPTWPQVSNRSSTSVSRPTSPRTVPDNEGYNSSDEQGPCYASTYDDTERERRFELDLRRAKGYEIRRMLEDGNCLFRAVADQVYGDPDNYDMARQMCVDYMERERDHFSQFITEGFTSYCKRKRKDKVYGNNAEIQAFAEMYNRPIHIYSYSTEPINIFHGSYHTDVPPIRLSYHHGNHYNSVVDPRRLAIGAGLGFSSLRGTNVDRDQVKAAIKAQHDQQIDSALLAEGRFYSDLELTEKEIERMVMEASRAEYLAEEKLKQPPAAFRESSTSKAEPSSSGASKGSSRTAADRTNEDIVMLPETALTSSMQLLLAMGFGYMQVMEAYSIFGDDVDSMICYLVETGATSSAAGGSYRRKGKAAE